ncbi:MAG: hypothetical protein JNL36_00910 [Candidatus Kapabacteria bacterium]|nr:hypothetical protein [Candidatus Kapabacteria bacterium]
MKIFVNILIGLLFISCKDSNVNPTPDPVPEPCEVPIIYSSGGHVLDYTYPVAVTLDNKYFIFAGGNRDSTIAWNLYDNQKSTEEYLYFETFLPDIIKNSPRYGRGIPFPCPYNHNLLLFEISYVSDLLPPAVANNVNSIRYIVYDLTNKSVKDITPLQYFETGVPRSLGIRFMTWLSKSSEGNDFFDCGKSGVFHVQSAQIVESNPTVIVYLNVGSSGKIKIQNKVSDTLFSINNVSLNFDRNRIRSTRISPDEKFAAVFVERQGTDYLWPYYYWEMYIIDVEKTLSTGTMVIHSKIDFPTKLCAFQASSNFVLTPNNTIIISFSRYTIQEKSNLYEIDFNGKILRQLTNE